MLDAICRDDFDLLSEKMKWQLVRDLRERVDRLELEKTECSDTTIDIPIAILGQARIHWF